MEHGILTGVTPSTLFAYARFAYSARMVFVELTPFVAFRNEYWTDEDLRALQSFLLVSPEAGDLIRGGSGLRKLRWSAQGRGKRGGARVIYYWHKPKHYVYLIYGYVKSEREDLSAATGTGAGGVDEGCKGWISGISIDWLRACAR